MEEKLVINQEKLIEITSMKLRFEILFSRMFIPKIASFQILKDLKTEKLTLFRKKDIAFFVS